ncbi:uncharacterized protein LOC115734409 isoform X2 [Rhodamnia argentea]|uniref:Uncharacterized protein LOC115734409 isoform X2 n=1 Tax=Rhodamnia argentea TaxID=178133 RepID=A0A8B8NFR0_9MYRT|nr:uncharacterized protein LOC115734409 isoform X2 [Rhodamnia argentea]
MANGTDSEEFVVLSRVRPGLKREFAFALKAQSEIRGSFGRTRARKVQNGVYSDGVSSSSGSKRLKKSPEAGEGELAVRKPVSEGERAAATGVVANVDAHAVKGEKTGRHFEGAVDLMSEEEAKSDMVDVEDVRKSSLGDSLSDNGLKSDIPTENVGFKPEIISHNGAVNGAEASPKGPAEIETTLMETKEDKVGKDADLGKIHELPFTEDQRKVEIAPLSGNKANQVLAEKPYRRFTRSALKPKEDVVEKTVAKNARKVSHGKVIGDGGDMKLGNGAISLVNTPTKLELKMSKKIALKKPFSTLKDFLETGLLEGLAVKYFRVLRDRKREKGLGGVIRGAGIQCSCEDCKGVDVVSPTIFELHAGSLNKRPPEYIFLENGKTLRDVMNAVKNAQLDTMEEAVQAVLGSSRINKCNICLNCKGAISKMTTGNPKLLCNSCLELRQSQVSPGQVVATEEAFLDEVSFVAQASPDQAAVAEQASAGVATVSPRRLPETHPALESSADLSAGPAKVASSQAKSWGKLTRKDLRLHKLVFEEDVLPDGTEVAYFIRGKKLLVGYKKGFGIFCTCCDSEVSPSQFEAHAGWPSRRKPYLNIYTSNGVSLHELAISLSRSRKLSASENDDLCTICLDGGDLLCCDTCPRAFHLECISLSRIPKNSWNCKYCLDMHQREKFVEYNVNAVAAGRIAGADPIEQITKRCIRIVKTPETEEVGVCALCRSKGFTKSGFGPRTVIICDQCEKEFHVCCLRDHKVADLKELPEGNWFCCMDCERMHSALEEMVIQGEKKLPDSLLDVIKKKREEKDTQNESNLDIRWRILNNKILSDDASKQLLHKSVALFHERFDPIAETKSGRDLIPAMVYGRRYKDQVLSGMFCVILIVDHAVVSAGTLRIFGQEMAELPLVATSTDCQGQGYFQSLFGCIERLLHSLNVKNLVLPAAEEAESIWTNRFGFCKMTSEELKQLRRNRQMMVFQGTTVLHKAVPVFPERE